MPIRSLNGPNVFPFACDRPSAVGVVQSILIVVGPPLGGFIFGGAFMNVFFGILNKTDGVSAFRRSKAAGGMRRLLSGMTGISLSWRGSSSVPNRSRRAEYAVS